MISEMTHDGNNVIINALSNAEANIHARLDSGTFHLEADVDFDPTDSSPAAHIVLLPNVSGVESFLMELHESCRCSTPRSHRICHQ